MKIVDVNILLYAINKDDPLHPKINKWWRQSLSSSESIGLSWLVIVGFVRLATLSKVFANPLSPEQATQQVNQWLNHANVRLVKESNNHWRILQQLLIETGKAGNLTSDAHLAALAISGGSTLISCDNDFSRFPQLRWENPTA